MGDILSIGKSALNAANVAITTTGHNIANATTPGYSRQVIFQAAIVGQKLGAGYLGKGTEITAVRRVYSDFLGNQVLSAQTSKSQLETYYTQIKQIDNMLADSTVGLSPALQDFFKAVQNVSSSPNSAAVRQSLLSSSETMAARFQSFASQLNDIQQGVNDQIVTSITAINTYAKQIAQLNDAIELAQGASSGSMPNDLLDQRDLAIAELSKEVKVSIVKQGNSYDIYIGNGQPLVVGTDTYNLKALPATTDPSRMEVAYEKNGVTTLLAETGLNGGSLAGLLDFRRETLDVAQNSLGRIAIALASDFNAQHKLGMQQEMDSSGNPKMGGDFFNIASPLINPSSRNQGSGTVAATIDNASALTTSDYQLEFNGSTYNVTRLSDGSQFSVSPGAGGTVIDGIKFTVSGGFKAGDSFLVRPTANGASGMSVAIKTTAEIAAAAPIRTTAASANQGKGAISAGVVNKQTNNAATLTYNAGNLTGFPADQAITIKSGGTTTVYPAGTTPIPYANGATVSYGGVSFVLDGAPPANGSVFNAATNFSTLPSATLTYSSASGGTIGGFTTSVTVTNNGVSTIYPGPIAPATTISIPYSDGATISYGGASFVISGTPANGDTFSIGANKDGTGDNRNMLLLAALQSANSVAGKTTNYQGAYSQFVNFIGNKTAELEATTSAADQLLTRATEAQQAESGVNLDEEAANLIRYQQAYQAAAKVMKTASDLFDTLLSISN